MHKERTVKHNRFTVVARIVLGIFAALLFLNPQTALSQTTGSTTATGTSNELNPAISFNGLFLGYWSEGSEPEEEHHEKQHGHVHALSDGIKAQEFELAMTAVVDPYFKAAAYVAYEPSSEGPEAVLAAEEVYIQTTSLPTGLGVRAGRFFLPFGRHNQIHVHQYPFIQAPLAMRRLIGDEGAGDVGVEVSYSPPVPWYLNLRGVVGDGAVEGIFDAENSEMSYLGRVENLWDLSEAATLEAGLSLLRGPLGGEHDHEEHLKDEHDEAHDTEHLSYYGADLRIKWKDPRKTHGRALVWENEFIGQSVPGRKDSYGFFSLARFRAARLWWIGGGYSFLSQAHSEREIDHEIKGQVALVLSEFSALRFDLAYNMPEEGDSRITGLLQVNFTIGAHPAHGY
jgi:hypothetical protein